MINKLIDQLSTDILEFFNKYNIKLSSQYTPDLPGIMNYSRNFLARTLSPIPVSNSLDGTKYQNKLLYRVDTPKPVTDVPQNNRLSIITGNENVSQDFTITSTGNTITKTRIPSVGDTGDVKVRNVSILEVPVEFTIITESLDLIFAVSSLFYQELVNQNVLTLSLDLFSDGNKTIVPYFMNWDRESLEISYANFENISALNTLTFKLKLQGAIFSEFYTDDHIINQYEITVGNMKQL